ncbi:FMN-binding domain-containing protein [Streptomyces sp. Ag109_O5-10]|uniref:FMN-binding protein n=1 Tax=Streptomyces sp. Ag109_O5-10 TaxID=1855349 RepID=UPI00089B4565|nr:FMN-binding domain-containing protein [Streptomyces sp. Ag109_O5-10]SEE35848.1 hypothetical protein SAMN05216533_2064 [Streptomyces sp. Ag109_O5-10]
MQRAIPVVVLSIAGLVPVWRYEPSTGGTTTAGTSAAEPAPSSSAAASSGTVVKGTTVTTDKGPVQVRVTFSGDRISAVTMLRQPNHPQTAAAVPVLVSETLKAQSADVDTVSGADAVATAAFAMGAEGVVWAAAHPGCEVFAVDAGRQVLRTAGFPVAGERPAAA